MKRSVTLAGLIFLVLIILNVSVMAAPAPSTISPALKQSDGATSYDDAAFKELAGHAIYNLTDPMPTGTPLMELKSTYYDLVKKNISPEFYSEAKDTANYLFYAMTAAEEFQDYNEHTSTKGNNVDFYYETLDQARSDLSAANRLWPNISVSYPNATAISQ